MLQASVVHLAGPVPAVGEMLVGEDRHEAIGAAHDGDDVVEEAFARILVDADGHAQRLERIEHDESHQLVEEFMLAANEAVARLTRTRRLPSLYRVHDDPEPARLLELRETLAKFGIKTGDLSNRRELTRLLALLADHPQGHTLRTQLLRSLRKAAYRHTPDGHFGLHKRDYTHFTSPIRRYADLVVHRVLAAHLAKPGAPAAAHDLPQVTRLGEHLTRTEVNSAEAERESVKVKLVEYFDRELGRTRCRALASANRLSRQVDRAGRSPRPARSTRWELHRLPGLRAHAASGLLPR